MASLSTTASAPVGVDLTLDDLTENLAAPSCWALARRQKADCWQVRNLFLSTGVAGGTNSASSSSSGGSDSQGTRRGDMVCRWGFEEEPAFYSYPPSPLTLLLRPLAAQLNGVLLPNFLESCLPAGRSMKDDYYTVDSRQTR